MELQELEDGLSGFYGTETYHFNPLYPKMRYTDGVVFFALNAGGGAYWFLDIIGTEIHPLQAKEPFIAITLIASGGTAEIIATDGDERTLFTRHISWTDCPEGRWRFFLCDDVLLLTGEY